MTFPMPPLTLAFSSGHRFAPAPLFPRVFTSILNRIADRFWEHHFNIATRGGAASAHPDANAYGYLAYHTYFSIFKRLQLTPSDVVVDLGCGKGRVSCLAASHPIAASLGIEIDHSLCELARANGRRMRHRRAALRFFC